MKRIVLIATLTIAGLGGLVVAYAAFVARPDLLFGHRYERAGFRIYSRSPIDDRIAPSLDSAAQRLTRSPLWIAGRVNRVYVTGSRGLYAFFTGPGRFAMAKNFEVGNSIFVPLVDLATGSIVHFDGRREPVSAILTHEAAHTDLQRAAGGVLALWKLPFWKKEGYSELVAYGDNLSLVDATRMLRASTGASVRRSPGLTVPRHYFVAELLWIYLVRERHMTVQQVLQVTTDEQSLLERIQKS